MLSADAVHGVGNPGEMLNEVKGDLLIHWVVIGENDGDLQHALAVEGHPCRAIRLLQGSAGWKRGAAVKYADVVQPQEATSEDIAACGIFPVDPPVEIQHQGVEHSFEE